MVIDYNLFTMSSEMSVMRFPESMPEVRATNTYCFFIADGHILMIVPNKTMQTDSIQDFQVV